MILSSDAESIWSICLICFRPHRHANNNAECIASVIGSSSTLVLCQTVSSLSRSDNRETHRLCLCFARTESVLRYFGVAPYRALSAYKRRTALLASSASLNYPATPLEYHRLTLRHNECEVLVGLNSGAVWHDFPAVSSLCLEVLRV